LFLNTKKHNCLFLRLLFNIFFAKIHGFFFKTEENTAFLKINLSVLLRYLFENHFPVYLLGFPKKGIGLKPLV